MKHTGRMLATLLIIAIYVGILIYRYLMGKLAEPYYDLIFILFLLLPVPWWLGKQYDKANYYLDKLKDRKAELDSLFNNSASFLWTNDLTEQKLKVSKGIESLYGYSAKEFEEDYELWLSTVYSDDKEKANRFYRHLLSGDPSRDEWRFIRKDGETRWLEAFGNPIYNHSGKLIKLNGVAYDITERKQMEEKLHHMAYYDNLTNLPNRKMLNEYFQKELTRCKQYQQKLAVLFIDLDEFKSINDTLGHDAGDQLLKQVAERLEKSVRQQDIVARLSGDEFIILLEISSSEKVKMIADHLVNHFNEPFELNGKDHFNSLSIGISVYPNDGDNINTLIKKADSAMYLAKKRGENNYKFSREARLLT
ncbi:sensor domain-containing diguanylate cyclase [Bacillus shivajii]|uniref:sensor domain-containing protein n=1 Tax=Bacillus shivajii TaxID=1983719 RepID=UPI001CFA66B2|nr:sensor domain-containing diguanylate cyclase [Bacillus shivajii]UCZ51510.1 sensor domain-containing diguanylate cyclase [Bacillus shivajii]